MDIALKQASGSYGSFSDCFYLFSWAIGNYEYLLRIHNRCRFSCIHQPIVKQLEFHWTTWSRTEISRSNSQNRLKITRPVCFTKGEINRSESKKSDLRCWHLDFQINMKLKTLDYLTIIFQIFMNWGKISWFQNTHTTFINIWMNVQH